MDSVLLEWEKRWEHGMGQHRLQCKLWPYDTSVLPYQTRKSYDKTVIQLRKDETFTFLMLLPTAAIKQNQVIFILSRDITKIAEIVGITPSSLKCYVALVIPII